jgi:branched-chain amino acid transport system permease protein
MGGSSQAGAINIAWVGVVLAVFVVLPIFIGTGWISVITEMLIMAIAATGLNLMLGYAGMISFGAAGIYAVGAYTTALILVKTSLPFGLGFIAGPVAAGLASVIIGWFCVRLTHIYFALLTLAFSQIIYTIVFTWYSFTKGDDGIAGIPVPAFLVSVEHYYYFALITAVVCFMLLWIIANSPFGKTLKAIRENPQRVLSVGIPVRRYQLGVFVLSGFFLGAAGSLFCGFNKNVFPDYAHWAKSADMLAVCLLGGIYNFFGPFVGSIIYIFLDKVITGVTEYWSFFLGLIIVLLVLFLPGGVVGFVLRSSSLVRGGDEKGNSKG